MKRFGLRIHVLSGIGCFLFAFVAYAGDANLDGTLARQPIEMTLADAVHLAVRHNRTIQSAYLDRVIQKFDLRVAEDKFFPDINVTGSVERAEGINKDDAVGNNTVTTEDSAGGKIEITETIPTGGTFSFAWTRSSQWAEANTTEQEDLQIAFTQPLLKNFGIDVNTGSVDIARLEEQKNILLLQETLIDTITSVINAYRSFLQTQKEVDILKASLDRSKSLLQINRYLIAAGRMASMEMIQTQADIAQKEFDYETARNTLTSMRLSLLKLLDIDKHTRIRAKDESIESLQIPDLDDSLALAYANRPDYLTAKFNLLVSDINLKLASNNKRWTLDFTSSYSYRLSGDERGNADWRAGLELSIPLYGDLTREQSIVDAKITQKKEKLSFQEKKDNVDMDVRDTIQNAHTKFKQLKLAKLARELSEKKLEIEEQKMKVGRSSNFTLVTFQNDLVDAENNELMARIDLFNALTYLDQTLGTTLKTWNIKLKEDQK
jgi:outer membrane protein